MAAVIHQRPGPTWTLEVEIPAFTEKTLTSLVEQGLKEAISSLVEQKVSKLIDKAACVKVHIAAKILDIKTVATLRSYMERNPKDPKYLPHIPGDNGAAGDLIRLADLIAWTERNSKPDAREKLNKFIANSATQ